MGLAISDKRCKVKLMRCAQCNRQSIYLTMIGMILVCDKCHVRLYNRRRNQGSVSAATIVKNLDVTKFKTIYIE